MKIITKLVYASIFISFLALEIEADVRHYNTSCWIDEQERCSSQLRNISIGYHYFYFNLNCDNCTVQVVDNVGLQSMPVFNVFNGKNNTAPFVKIVHIRRKTQWSILHVGKIQSGALALSPVTTRYTQFKPVLLFKLEQTRSLIHHTTEFSDSGNSIWKIENNAIFIPKSGIYALIIRSKDPTVKVRHSARSGPLKQYGINSEKTIFFFSGILCRSGRITFELEENHGDIEGEIAMIDFEKNEESERCLKRHIAMLRNELVTELFNISEICQLTVISFCHERSVIFYLYKDLHKASVIAMVLFNANRLVLDTLLSTDKTLNETFCVAALSADVVSSVRNILRTTCNNSDFAKFIMAICKFAHIYSSIYLERYLLNDGHLSLAHLEFDLRRDLRFLGISDIIQTRSSLRDVICSILNGRYQSFEYPTFL